MPGARVSLSRRSSAQAIRSRAATLADHERIQALQARYGLGARSYADWTHLWLDNPAWQRNPDLAIGWVLEDAAGRLVGWFGSIPFLFELRGRQFVANTSHAWVVDAPYRAYAPLLFEQFLTQPGVALHLPLYPNRESEPAIALRCPRVPVGVWDEYAFWITRHRPYAENALRRRGYRAAWLLSYPAAVALWVRERLRTPAVRRGDADVRPCSAFDERFDDFWHEARRTTPHLLQAVRTREVLDWHYAHALAHDRLWIATVVDGARIVAYATFDRKNATTMRLVDFQSLDGTTTLLSPLLHWALRRCRREGIVTLMAVGRWLEQGELLDRLAPYRRRLRNWLYFYHTNDPALAEQLKQREVWAPTLFDGDESLVPHAGAQASIHAPQDAAEPVDVSPTS
jgi:hypothetical protein